MAQRDVVLRWIEQVAKAVHHLLYGPGPPDIELAADHVEAAIGQHLGSLATLITHLDVTSAANLLREPDRIFGYAQLLSLRGAVQFARREAEAIHSHDLALAFAREALARSPDAPLAWHDWVAEAQAWRQNQPISDPSGAS